LNGWGVSKSRQKDPVPGEKENIPRRGPGTRAVRDRGWATAHRLGGLQQRLGFGERRKRKTNILGRGRRTNPERLVAD